MEVELEVSLETAVAPPWLEHICRFGHENCDAGVGIRV